MLKSVLTVYLVGLFIITNPTGVYSERVSYFFIKHVYTIIKVALVYHNFENKKIENGHLKDILRPDWDLYFNIMLKFARSI